MSDFTQPTEFFRKMSEYLAAVEAAETPRERERIVREWGTFMSEQDPDKRSDFDPRKKAANDGE